MYNNLGVFTAIVKNDGLYCTGEDKSPGPIILKRDETRVADDERDIAPISSGVLEQGPPEEENTTGSQGRSV